MENLEQYWEQSFSPIGRKFTEIRPNYQDMGETDSMVAALYWLELEMYNGGFLQFFCNWGYDAYLLAIKGLGAINATYTEQLLIQAYGIRHTGGEGRLYARLMLHYPVQGVYFFFRILYELHIAGTYDAGEGVTIGAGVRVFNKLAPAVQLEAYRGVLF